MYKKVLTGAKPLEKVSLLCPGHIGWVHHRSGDVVPLLSQSYSREPAFQASGDNTRRHEPVRSLASLGTKPLTSYPSAEIHPDVFPSSKIGAT